MNKAGRGGETKWRVSFPKFVKGKIIVIRKVTKEIATKGELGYPAFE